MILKKGQWIEPLEGCSLEATVVEVVPIDVDARPKQFVPQK